MAEQQQGTKPLGLLSPSFFRGLAPQPSLLDKLTGADGAAESQSAPAAASSSTSAAGEKDDAGTFESYNADFFASSGSGPATDLSDYMSILGASSTLGSGLQTSGDGSKLNLFADSGGMPLPAGAVALNSIPTTGLTGSKSSSTIPLPSGATILSAPPQQGVAGASDTKQQQQKQQPPPGHQPLHPHAFDPQMFGGFAPQPMVMMPPVMLPPGAVMSPSGPVIMGPHGPVPVHPSPWGARPEARRPDPCTDPRARDSHSRGAPAPSSSSSSCRTVGGPADSAVLDDVQHRGDACNQTSQDNDQGLDNASTAAVKSTDISRVVGCKDSPLRTRVRRPTRRPRGNMCPCARPSPLPRLPSLPLRPPVCSPDRKKVHDVHSPALVRGWRSEPPHRHR